MKQINITFFLTMLMSMVGLNASAHDIEVKNADGKTIYYNYVSTTTKLVVTSRGSSYSHFSDEYTGDIVIPESVTYNNKTYSVIGIKSSTFSKCSELTSVVIPSSVTYIGEYAFDACASLKQVTIQGNLNDIGQYAFRDCVKLENINLPSSITSIGEYAFDQCKKIKEIILPENIEILRNGVFNGCTGLTEITIPDKVKTINYKAFYGCTNLKDITFSPNITSIGQSAFENCISLSNITLPESLTEIDLYAFQNCTSLNNVFIPKNVTNIRVGAFGGCTKLTDVTFEGKTIPSYDYPMLEQCFGNQVKKYTLSEETTIIGIQAFKDCTELADIIIPANVTNIKSGAFLGCAKLKNIIIPQNVTSIENYAFDGCTGLLGIYCNAQTPPSLYAGSFTNSVYNNATLYVLKGTKELYKNATGWKNFSNIVEYNPSFTIDYKVDGEIYKSYEIEYGSAITPEAAPTKEGNTFSGWSEIPATMPMRNIEINGSFTINKYRILLFLDNEYYKDVEFVYNSDILLEDAPAKENYTFEGWQDVPEKMPARSLVIKGTYSINKYKLTYFVDNEEYKSYEVEFGSAITPETAPTKVGYTFSGWSEIPETMPAQDVVVTGTFSVNKYKLTYFVDNEEYKSYEVEFGSTITPETAPTKEGYTFSGWSEIPETMPAQDVDIYGTYSKETGVNSIYTTDNSETKFFSLDGKQFAQPQKGLNILKMSDGTTRKVVK